MSFFLYYFLRDYIRSFIFVSIKMIPIEFVFDISHSHHEIWSINCRIKG
ncbi:hypothetical protein MtrunA17_Chr1g0167521 [Medicago truncatula]|uniref:Uncharacterized protein n=1 Tax=Medicago truncatula TaxID=3880 RepID=A0A396JN14_MEDTR|nr:hypothetical protein MtrunA17_Chr1g0167521 [Medicago truncatula]